MRVRAVGHELSILIGQQLRCKFLDFVRGSEFPEPTRGNVQGSGNMSLAVVFGCKGLNNLDCVLPVELGFQLFRGDSVFYADLPENPFILIGAPSLAGGQFY